MYVNDGVLLLLFYVCMAQSVHQSTYGEALQEPVPCRAVEEEAPPACRTAIAAAKRIGVGGGDTEKVWGNE